MNNKPRYAPSTKITVRYHDDELVKLKKNMKKAKAVIKADYIRNKSLQ